MKLLTASVRFSLCFLPLFLLVALIQLVNSSTTSSLLNGCCRVILGILFGKNSRYNRGITRREERESRLMTSDAQHNIPNVISYLSNNGASNGSMNAPIVPSDETWINNKANVLDVPKINGGNSKKSISAGATF